MDFLTRIVKLTCLFSAALAATAQAQISPGELARQHADLEGIKNCLKCHDLGEGPSDKKCIGCHREIEVRVDGKRGYHYLVTAVENRNCFECHSEHAGRDYELVHWPGGINNFEHEQTGYKLEGKHGGLKCRDCHRASLIHEDMTAFADVVDTERTFLGLDQKCLACHADAHRRQLPEECMTCHTYDGWTPAPGFDHSKARYRLTGAHRKVACAKCHPAIEDPDPPEGLEATYAKYKNIPFDNCVRCHTDVHKGTLGADCTKCHNTTRWLDIDLAGFDHSKTDYPLLGRHAKVTCEKCHKPGVPRKPLPHQLCTDCHADAHRQQFAGRPDGGKCESCHTVNGFSPSTYTVADHNESRFRLEGAHAAVPCFACHPVENDGEGGSDRRFVFENTSCESCHRDIHFGQFSQSRKKKQCTDCHTVVAWKEIDFDHDRDSSYRLEGEHRRVPCKGCHVSVSESGNTFIRYRPIDPSCRTCHEADGLKLNTGNTEERS